MKHGDRLVGGTVYETCEAAGLQAVCFGHAWCWATDTSKCMVTPLTSSDCNDPLLVSLFVLSSLITDNLYIQPRDFEKTV